MLKSNKKYVTEVCARLDLASASTVGTPITEDLMPREKDARELLSAEGAKEYRRLSCVLLYACHDITEAQGAVRVLPTNLRSPNMRSWERLKRLARCFKDTQEESHWVKKPWTQATRQDCRG